MSRGKTTHGLRRDPRFEAKILRIYFGKRRGYGKNTRAARPYTLADFAAVERILRPSTPHQGNETT